MTRMLVTTSAVTVIACATLAWLLVERDLAQIRQAMTVRGQSAIRSLAREAQLAMLNRDMRALRRTARDLRMQDDVAYVSFYDAHGTRISTTGGKATATRVPGSTQVWEFRAPVVSDQPGPLPRTQIGTAAVGISAAFMYRHTHELIVTAAWFTVGVTLLATLLAMVVAVAVTRPLAKLAAASDRVARGELVTVDVRDGTEIGRLAQSFNAMVASLAESRAALEDHNRTLEAKVKARTERLELTNRELEEASGLKTEFLATVSHELRTPLSVIIGHVDMLADEAHGAITPAQRDTLASIRRYSLHQLDLVTNVLDFSRLSTGKVSVHLQAVDLTEVAREVGELCAGRHGRSGVAIRVDVAPDVPAMTTDRVKLQEIVRNLVDNALKYTPEGEVVIRARHGGVRVCIEVQDSGCGIPARDLPHIFDEFKQVSSDSRLRAGGVGLGLTIVKRLVYVLGGTIHVTSQLGVGTTFVVDLPVRHATARAAIAA